MAETETKVNGTERCKVCEGTGKAHLGFTGASGILLKDVPCPECSDGITLAIARDAVASKLRSDMAALAVGVIIACALACVAVVVAKKAGVVPPDGFAQVLKEEVQAA